MTEKKRPMKKLFEFVRTFNAGDWIAAVVVASLLVWVLWHTVGNIWTIAVLSLQPPLPDGDELARIDVIAQRSMSAAAWWMVVLTGVGLTVGAISVYLLKLNLDEARKVTAEAARSSAAAEAAVAESKIAAAENFRLGKKQVKAYVNVSVAEISIGRGKARVSYTVSNSGQSPAYTVYVKPRMRFWADDVPSSEHKADWFVITVLHTGGERKEVVHFDLIPIPFKQLMHVMVDFETSYTDVFRDGDVVIETYEAKYPHGMLLSPATSMKSVAGSMA